ncbi:MAG TPA: 3-oxoacyl-[acyl-carrier-protein] synthase III C-terminal domain-containing protein [Opitutaceae bacterium]|jgi:alkylresorcinol/alkylpyrone synthase|nr:3-oxoacyl-[acyl-carrier-protein] synthase III C-terminal domain-containing protein [Opitutaceae bacterium]
MYLHALATAVPPQRYSQADCWAIVEGSPARARLHKRSRLILHSVLRGDHGVAHRHFAVPDIGRIFDLTPDELNLAFRAAAPPLAATALSLALERAHLAAADIDTLLICTCTGYLCPGVTSYVAEQLGLKPSTYLQDLVGLGCGAAIPALRAASHALAARPDSTVACVAVEICSAAFYLDDDPGVLISACLFADGAAATIWRARPPDRDGSPPLHACDFQTVHRPADRDKLRFELKDGKLRNLLDRTVPELAAGAVRELWDRRGDRPVARVVSHSGGVDVLDAIAAALPEHSLAASRTVLREYGNMSSPSVLFSLEETLRSHPSAPEEGDLWLVSFGAGFAAHSCRLSPLTPA